MRSSIRCVLFATLLLAAVLAAAAAWRHSTDDSNTLPMGRILSAEQLARLPAPEKAEGPQIVRLGKNLFALVNPTRFPINYSGYTVHAWTDRPPLGAINPLYQQEFRTAPAAWQSNSPGWCGNGTGVLTVRPGQAGRFNTHTGVDLPPERTGEEHRVGVTYWSDDPRNVQTVWSEPFRP